MSKNNLKGVDFGKAGIFKVWIYVYNEMLFEAVKFLFVVMMCGRLRQKNSTTQLRRLL